MRPSSQFPADLVTFSEEILNGKLHFCAVDLSALGKSIVFRVSGTLRNQFRVCVSGGKNSLFFGKFGVFCFL